jgi:hypothetical protein
MAAAGATVKRNFRKSVIPTMVSPESEARYMLDGAGTAVKYTNDTGFSAGARRVSSLC